MLLHYHNSTSRNSIAGRSTFLAAALFAAGFCNFLAMGGTGLAQTVGVTLPDAMHSADANRPCGARAFTVCRHQDISLNTDSKADVAGLTVPEATQSADANRPCGPRAFTVCRHIDAQLANVE